MARKKISHSATGNTQESGASEPIKKPGHDHSLDVLRPCARHNPDNEEECGYYVDWLASIKLDGVSAICLALSSLTVPHPRCICSSPTLLSFMTSNVHDVPRSKAPTPWDSDLSRKQTWSTLGLPRSRCIETRL